MRKKPWEERVWTGGEERGVQPPHFSLFLGSGHPPLDIFPGTFSTGWLLKCK